MKNFLKKLRLIDCSAARFQINRNEFVDKLYADVDQTDIGLFSDITNSFPLSKNKFKGRVNVDGFKLKMRLRFFDNNTNYTVGSIFTFAVANGTFEEQNNKLVIKTEINGFSRYLAAFFIVCYTMPFLELFRKPHDEAFFVLFFLSLHATFMLILLYLFMRRSMKRLKAELEKEFYSLTKDG